MTSEREIPSKRKHEDAHYFDVRPLKKQRVLILLTYLCKDAVSALLTNLTNCQKIWHKLLESLKKAMEAKIDYTLIAKLNNILLEYDEGSLGNNDYVVKTSDTAVSRILNIILNWRATRRPGIGSKEANVMDNVLQLITEHFVKEHIDTETNLLTMQYQQVKSLLVDIPRDITKATLTKLIKDGSIQFPYKKYFEASPSQLFMNLQQYKPVISNKPFSPNGCKVYCDLFPVKFRGQYCVLSNIDENYSTIDVIADHFTEEQRMKAVRADQTGSPMDYWRENMVKLLDGIAQHKKDVTTRELREELYHHVRECTQFKPTVALSIYQILKAKRILDFSAGWGDRMIAAMASEAERYLGFDPNTDLRSGHLSAVRTLYPKEKLPEKESEFPENVKVIYEPFESATIPKGNSFDLCFTSPPFFAFEIYTKQPTQSVESFPDFAQWMKKFLFVSLKKAWEVLDMDGHLAIHIVDAGRNKVVEPMNLFIQYSLAGASYRGVIGTEGASTKVFPIWIWQKTKDNDLFKQSKALSIMQRYYKNLYQ